METTKWTSSSEKLPLENGEYIVCYRFNNGPIFIGLMRYYAGESQFLDEGYGGLKVTHWMPLPEPPEEFIFKGCLTCKHIREWSMRCAYCKSNKDIVGAFIEWEPNENESKEE